MTEALRRSWSQAADDAAIAIEAVAQDHFQAGTFPEQLMGEIADQGMLGLLVPEQYGGLGLDSVSYVEALARLGAADSAVALSCEVHALAVSLVSEHGTAEQRARWLPRFAVGRSLSGMGLTEPDAGSDLAAVQTTARAKDGGWTLSGRKCWITNTGTSRSDGLVVLARIAEQERKYGLFLLPDDTRGYLKGPKLDTLGWRSMDTREINFDDCVLGADHLLGPAGAGMSLLHRALALGRIGFAAIAVGLATACLNACLSHAAHRHQFGRPIGQFQGVQFLIADLATELAASRALVLDVARRRDEGEDWEGSASMAKLFAGRVCVRAADTAMHVHASRGFARDHPVARYYADAKMMEIGEGTSEMQRLIIARSLGC